MQLYTRLSNCSPPLGKVLRSIAKGRRLAKVRAANPEDCVRGAWSEVMSEVLPAQFQGKVAEVKLSQKARNRLLQSGAEKQEKGTEDHSTELQESERSPAEQLAKEREKGNLMPWDTADNPAGSTQKLSLLHTSASETHGSVHINTQGKETKRHDRARATWQFWPAEGNLVGGEPLFQVTRAPLQGHLPLATKGDLACSVLHLDCTGSKNFC